MATRIAWDSFTFLPCWIHRALQRVKAQTSCQNYTEITTAQTHTLSPTDTKLHRPQFSDPFNSILLSQETGPEPQDPSVAVYASRFSPILHK